MVTIDDALRGVLEGSLVPGCLEHQELQRLVLVEPVSLHGDPHRLSGREPAVQRADLRTYLRSAEHRASHGRIEPDLKQAISLERLEQLHTYEVVAT